MKANKYKVSISITGSKGGVGKSTITALLAQWLAHKGITINISDVDGAKSSISRWITSCQRLLSKEQFHNNEADVNLIDTGGRIGSSLIKEVFASNIIILPFRPSIADIREVSIWFLDCDKSIQEKIIFMPNFKRNSDRHTKNIEQIAKVIEKAGFSGSLIQNKLLKGLSDRHITYAKILDGSKSNFFTSLKNKPITEEIEQNFFTILNLIKDLI